MKKYNVRFYLHTFVDFEVEANSQEQAVEKAESMEYDMRQLFYNLTTDNEEDVWEIKIK